MMKKILAIIGFMVLSYAAMSQMQTLQFDHKKLQFDDGRQLPAEKPFMVVVPVSETVDLVKMQIANRSFDKDRILYESSWQRKKGDKNLTATLPNHHKLRSGKDYNFRFLYYRKLRPVEQRQIAGMLEKTVDAFLQSAIQQKGKTYRFSNSPSDIFEMINQVLNEGMINYETKIGASKPAFSGIIENMLHTVSKTKITVDTDGNAQTGVLDALHSQIKNEIEMLSNNYEFVTEENLVVSDYPVERMKNYLALNIGYGGVFNSGGFSDLDYFSAPYAGISFPLGNRVFSGRFWNNMSLSAGVFLTDFEVSDSLSYTGPIVKKPLYVAAGYRVFKYLRVHAGTTVLEKTENGINGKSVFLKPFVGLSFELSIWLGTNRK